MSVTRLLIRNLCLVFVLPVILCGLCSCMKKEEAPPVPASAPDAVAPASDKSAVLEKGEAAPARKRKIILNYALSLEVRDFVVSLEAVKQLAESSGGYVFNSSRSENESGSVIGRISIRVPSGKANTVMKGIRGLGRVESENSTAEDITEEYVDLEARLNNAKSSEARLLGLYRQTGKLSDVLAVEKELTRVRGDIEAFEAKKKNWDVLTEMVTIEISLHEPSGGFPSAHRFWSTITGGFGQSVEVIAVSLRALVVFIAGVLPWLAVFGPIMYLFVKWRRKKKRKKTDARQGEAEDNEQGAKMKTIILSVIFSSVVASTAWAQMTTATCDEKPEIKVAGEAVVTVKPDKIVAVFGVEAYEKTIMEAKNKSGVIMQKAMP